MKNLKSFYEGFNVFRRQYLQDMSPNEIRIISKKQTPRTLIVGCSDSRVEPAILLNFNLGEVFSVRNIANIVPPFQDDHSTFHGTSSALEYAVKILNVETLIVLGHSNCGGINALLEHEENDKSQFDYIIDWVFILKEAKTQVIAQYPHLSPEELRSLCEKKGIEISLKNLQTFPFIQERIANNTLQIFGLYFSLSQLNLEYYDPTMGSFQLPSFSSL